MARWQRRVRDCAPVRDAYAGFIGRYVVQDGFNAATTSLVAPGGDRNNLIWLLFDEPNLSWESKEGPLNVQEYWNLSPEVLEVYSDAIDARLPNSLKFLVLGGTIKGDTYTYDSLNTHHSGRYLDEKVGLPDSLFGTVPHGALPGSLYGDSEDYRTYRYSAKAVSH